MRRFVMARLWFNSFFELLERCYVVPRRAAVYCIAVLCHAQGSVMRVAAVQRILLFIVFEADSYGGGTAARAARKSLA